MENSFIKGLENKRSMYLNPDQACTQAQSLNLLSSGIYTEEERFVFELLQNAVDAYNDSGCLKVKILLNDNYLVFMHNGDKFSKRDIEGLCDVGNGNKMNDIRKIGYKGIGFKSVFMHSKNVTIESGDYCFKFNKAYWDNYWDNAWGEKDMGKTILMPWQIIPIETQPPIKICHDGYNVVNYIETSNASLLHKKIMKILETCDFLLFLRHENISIEYMFNDVKQLEINKSTQKNRVELKHNGIIESRWLVYSNPAVEIPNKIREVIKSDGITPIKLQEAKSFDLSFAVPITSKGNLEPLQESCVYTYLPTSISFGLPFLVNANFITDAGRQHLVKDSEWNKMIMNAIPYEFLTWISTISRKFRSYYKVLPKRVNRTDSLGQIFDKALNKAIDDIAFIPSLNGTLLKASDAIMDTVGISTVIGREVLLKHINMKYKVSYIGDSFISNDGATILKQYGVFQFNDEGLKALFDDRSAFEGISLGKAYKLINFLYEYCKKHEQDMPLLSKQLGIVKFLYTEDEILDCPENLFMPSKFRDDESIARDAKFLHEDICIRLQSTPEVIDWLYSVGLGKLDEIGLIKNLFCREGYINEENAVEVGQYIYNVSQEYDLFKEIGGNKLSYLRFLTKKNSLKPIEELFLGHEFNPDFDLEPQYDLDVFISEQYANNMDLEEWSKFFVKMGICVGISPVSKKVRWDELSNETMEFLQETKDTVETYSNPNGAWKNPFYLLYFMLNYFTLVEIENTPYGLAKIIWNYLFKSPIPEFRSDIVHGVYGCCWYSSYDITKWTKISYPHWILKTHQTFPTSTGDMLRASEIYRNTPIMKELFGSYLPFIDVECEIDESWLEILPFKVEPTLDDYLLLLTKISCDKEKVSDNMVRISKIYQRIVEMFDINSSKVQSRIREWSENAKILTQEGIFENPKQLRCITLEGFGNKNRAYIGKVEKRDEVIKLLSIMGVTIITEESVTPRIEDETISDEIKMCLLSKAKVLALLKSGERPTQEEFSKELMSIHQYLEKTQFFHCLKINLTYGDDEDLIQKMTFATGNKFYYSGELRISKIEPLLTPLCMLLNMKGKERELLVAMFENMQEIREYLKEKEYDVSFIEDVTEDSSHTFSPNVFIQRGEYQVNSDLYTGFKGEIIVFEKLKELGFKPECPIISDASDYDMVVEYKGNNYYCKTNYGRYDISFVNNSGTKIYVEVKSTITKKEFQTNMPINYREISLIEEMNSQTEQNYLITRVFNVNSERPEIFVFKGFLA